MRYTWVHQPSGLFPLGVLIQQFHRLKPIWWYSREDFFWGAASDVAL